MYAGVTSPVTEDDWHSLWRKRKKGTVPGKSKITVEMIAALPDEVSNDIRKLINTILLPGGGTFRM